MPLFRTPVEVVAPPRLLGEEEGYVFLGSCFAQHVGGCFEEARLRALVNPLGVLYNPASIAKVVAWAIEGKALDEACFTERDGMWHCWLCDSHLSAPTMEECRSGVERALQRLRQQLAEARYLFVTLGTNHCYLYGGGVVANCHKVPQKHFAEHEMTHEECRDTLREMLRLLQEFNPRLQVVFTVSPYRYRKYGYHGSQLGKATLLLAADDVARECPESVLYFPAYEIVLDELRDYRFYADDMLHPSPQAVRYIWQRLCHSWMSPQMQTYVATMEREARRHRHRPIAATSP